MLDNLTVKYFTAINIRYCNISLYIAFCCQEYIFSTIFVNGRTLTSVYDVGTRASERNSKYEIRSKLLLFENCSFQFSNASVVRKLKLRFGIKLSYIGKLQQISCSRPHRLERLLQAVHIYFKTYMFLLLIHTNIL